MKVKIIGQRFFTKVYVKTYKGITRKRLQCYIPCKYVGWADRIRTDDNVIIQKIERFYDESTGKNRFKKIGKLYVEKVGAGCMLYFTYPNIQAGDELIIYKIKILDPEIEIVTDTELEK